MKAFLAALQLLPEIWGMFKYIVKSIEDGVDQAILKKKLNAVTKAFKNPDKRKAAKELDDAFKS
jgi:hypothetical protein